MYIRLIAYITKNNILTEAQNGFKEGKSTETAVRDFLENIQQATDEKINLTVIFFELWKTYDGLYHKILLSQLDAYGMRGVANLSNWKQCFEVNYMESTKQVSGFKGG